MSSIKIKQIPMTPQDFNGSRVIRMADIMEDDEWNSLIDWIELNAFLNEEYLFSDMRQIDNISSDEELEDFGEEDSIIEDFTDKILNICCKRNEQLGESYPFDILENSIKLKAEALEDNKYHYHAYLYCLIMSHKDSDVAKVVGANTSIYELMEIYCTIVSAVHCGNAAHNGTLSTDEEKEHYLERLRRIFLRIFEEDFVVKEKPAGASISPKDLGFDSIAWNCSTKSKLGAVDIMFSQATVQNKWENKNITDDMNVFVKHWLTQNDIAHFKTSIHIPFIVHQSHMPIRIARFGNIFHRFEISRKMQEFTIMDTSGRYIELADELHRIKEYLESLRAA